ncbi:MAG TPA: class II fructose-bisphosphate aldolase [Clostridiaceae bacterium]|nr:class II fructose-bisphosphate aldolase [Clostridiaceae bacterium]
MRINYRELIEDAQNRSYAIGYFEAWNIESLISIVKAAENKRSPVMIGFCGEYLENAERKYEVDLELFSKIAKEVALKSSVPVITLLNESNTVEYTLKGIEAGFDSVMYVDEKIELEEMIIRQQKIVDQAHRKGILVEGEIGSLGLVDASSGDFYEGNKTRPEDAVYFAEKTNVDLLAISFGNVHLLEKSKAELDFDLLKTINEKVSIPLVLHGGTGIADEDFKKTIENGIVKVNIGAGLKREVIKSIQNYFEEYDVDEMNPNDVLGKGNLQDLDFYSHEGLITKVMNYMDLFNSTGKADKYI